MHPFDLTQCQNQLKADYKTNRSEIGFLPGMPKEFNLDDFYVDLTLVQEEKRPTSVKKQPLNRYTDLLSLENQSGSKLDHVLVRGEAGTGKTTMISKLAYQWATLPKANETQHSSSRFRFVSYKEGFGYVETQHPLSRFDLVFALDIRNFQPERDLVGCIQDQLLPDMSERAIKSMLIKHADGSLFLFDGYDESKPHQQVLSSKLLHRSHVIVTTRPDKVDEFCDNYNGFVHVQLSGFSSYNQMQFIDKYFDSNSHESRTEPTQPNRTQDLWNRIQGSYLNILSCYPLLLAMMCTIFNTVGNIPARMSALYQQAIHAFALQFYARSSLATAILIDKNHAKEIDDIVLSLGPTALKGLLLQDTKLIFENGDFMTPDNNALPVETIDRAENLAILKKIHSNRRGSLVGLLTTISCNSDSTYEVCQYSFLHKTFQEFCAARYWSSLAVSDKEKFKCFLSYISEDNVENMQYLLRFCCGLSTEAAAIILQHVVNNCNSKWYLPVFLLFEAEKDSEIHPKLHDILGAVKIDFRLEMPPELKTILDHYLRLKEIDSKTQTWITNVEDLSIVINRLYHSDMWSMPFLSSASSSASFSSSLKAFKFVVISHKILSNEELQILIMLLKKQIYLRHLEVKEVNIRGNSSAWKVLLEALLTTAFFDLIIPNLESLSLSCLNLNRDDMKLLFLKIVEAGNRLHIPHSDAMDPKHYLPLSKLCLTGNKLNTCITGQNEFIEGLSYLSGLEHLELDKTGLTSSFFVAIYPIISTMSNLKVLNLGGNELQQAGSHLNICLKNLKNLKELRLNKTEMADDDICLMPLKNLTRLTKLNLDGNNFGSKGLIALSDSLKYVPMLTELRLDKNRIGKEGVIALIASLHSVPLLTELDITLNYDVYSILLQDLTNDPSFAHRIQISDDLMHSYGNYHEGFFIDTLCFKHVVMSDTYPFAM